MNPASRMTRRARRAAKSLIGPGEGSGPGQLYAQDLLTTVHNHEFMDDPAFAAAYSRGVQAGGFDFDVHWRVHVALWAARNASTLDGDFVECGTARGFISSAVLSSLPWSTLGKQFYLFDTFEPFDVQNREAGDNPYYARGGVDAIRENFAEWPGVHLVPGLVPGTLDDVDLGTIAYLHIDLNHPDPEVAAVRRLWPRLVTGGWMLLDDYAFHGYRDQKVAMDEVAVELGFSILSLPTGQGLVVKTAG
jgi:hypothetical protein